MGTRSLANHLKGKNIAVLVAHPGGQLNSLIPRHRIFANSNPVTLESSLLANSAIDQEYFGEAYMLAIERNDGEPLPPQNMVTLKQASGVVLYAALNPELRKEHAPFIVENQIYSETRKYADNDEDAEKLWSLSEKLVGETFSF